MTIVRCALSQWKLKRKFKLNSTLLKFEYSIIPLCYFIFNGRVILIGPPIPRKNLLGMKLPRSLTSEKATE